MSRRVKRTSDACSARSKPAQAVQIDAAASYLELKFTSINTSAARLTWRSPQDDWRATVALTNLTDKVYYNNKVSVDCAS